MKELDEKEKMSAEEMSNLKGGGYWVHVNDKWIWIENYSLDSDDEKGGE